MQIPQDLAIGSISQRLSSLERRSQEEQTNKEEIEEAIYGRD